MKGWGLGRRLGERHIVQRKKTMFFFFFLLLLRKLRSSQDSNWVLLNVNIHFIGAAARLLCDECFNTDYATTKLLHTGKGLVMLSRFLCARGEQRYVYGSSILCSSARASAAQLVRASDPYSEDPGFVSWLDLNVTFSMKIITEV